MKKSAGKVAVKKISLGAESIDPSFIGARPRAASAGERKKLRQSLDDVRDRLRQLEREEREERG